MLGSHFTKNNEELKEEFTTLTYILYFLWFIMYMVSFFFLIVAFFILYRELEICHCLSKTRIFHISEALMICLELLTLAFSIAYSLEEGESIQDFSSSHSSRFRSLVFIASLVIFVINVYYFRKNLKCMALGELLEMKYDVYINKLKTLEILKELKLDEKIRLDKLKYEETLNKMKEIDIRNNQKIEEILNKCRENLNKLKEEEMKI
jgi:hypothetical protein